MKDIPLVSFYTNSYNRLPFLKNLLKSFELCNQYPNVEWVITDYGSTDNSREYIKRYSEKSDFPVKYLFADENEYFRAINERGISISEKWAKFRAILAKYRNDARELAQGKYIVDVGSDHQFIRRGLWVDEIMEIFMHREAETGRDDVACIVNYGYPRWRFDKPNNALGEEKNVESVPYYVAKEKSYVDYNVMKRSTIDMVGKFLEPLVLQEGTSDMEMWENENDLIQPEAEYERRCHEVGLKRVFMKFPFLVSFPNSCEASMQEDELFVSLWTLEEMKNKFGHLNRPISSEELGAAIKYSVVVRGINLLKHWI